MTHHTTYHTIKFLKECNRCVPITTVQHIMQNMREKENCKAYKLNKHQLTKYCLKSLYVHCDKAQT